MGKPNARYCVKAHKGQWRVWDRKLNKWWGKPYQDFPQHIVEDLNDKKPRVVYKAYIKSRTWRRLRKRKLKSVDWKCEKCNNKEDLQVHHLNYDRLGKEKLTDLQVLCETCHDEAHGK